MEDLLASLYSYFISSCKRTLKFQKLVACLVSKGNKILGNGKTHWIIVFDPTNKVFEEYKPLVTKMATDAPKESTTKENLSMLLYWQSMLLITSLMLMPYSVNSLIKFAQRPTSYIFDFTFEKQFANVLYINGTLIHPLSPMGRSLTPLYPWQMTH